MVKHLFLILFLFIFKLTSVAQQEYSIKNGVLDLTNFNFKQNKTVKLKGEWEFYWKKLYTPKDFENQVHSPDAYLNVPDSWTTVAKEDTGYATLRLVIFIPDTLKAHFSLLIPEVLTAYKVWLNGKLLTEVGKVGKNSKEATPDVHFTINSFLLNSKKNELIVQISNYDHRDGAFAEAPVLGFTQSIIKKFTYRVALNLITFGLMLIMSLYHFGLFIMRRKNISALSFAILTLVLAVRDITVDTYTLQFLFPKFLNWKESYLIGYITFFTFIMAFAFFFQATFKDKKFRYIYYLTYAISFLFLLTLFLPSIIYTKLLIYYEIWVIFIVLFLLFLLVKYTIKKRKGAGIFLISFAILAASGIHDIGSYRGIYHSVPLLQYGVMALILGQALTLSKIFTHTFEENEKLTQTLNYQNENLQDIVKERTKETEKQKQDILMKNEELTVQKEGLQSQRDSILQQKEIIEQHTQLINDSIAYASTIQKAILPSTEKLNLYFEHFIIFLPKNIVSGDFYWFSDSNPEYLFFAVGDCTGHGVPGAFLSIINSYLLNNIINEKGTSDTKEILSLLEIKFNKFLNKQSNKSIDGMDIALLRFDKKDKKNVVFTAAKSSIIIIDSETKEMKRYRGDRKSIGYLTNNSSKSKIPFTKAEIQINDNSLIYCYSDGYIDQNNIERKRFGTNKFQNLLKNIADRPIQQQKLALLKELENWKGNSDQRDDITVIGLKRR